VTLGDPGLETKVETESPWPPSRILRGGDHEPLPSFDDIRGQFSGVPTADF